MEELELYKLLLQGMIAEASEEEKVVIQAYRDSADAFLDDVLKGDDSYRIKLRAVGMVSAAVFRAEELAKFMG